MKKHQLVFLSFLVACMLPISAAEASPKKIEMIFLSPKKLTSALEIINQYEKIKLSTYYVATNFPENCKPMGDGCFHPQLGYIEEKKEDKKNRADKEFQLKTINATDVSLINCDPNNYFDIYCGRAKDKEETKKLHIWFDISSSLKSVDYSPDGRSCDRKVFIEKVVFNCGNKVSYSVFNTSLKEAGEFSTVCETYGTNDQKKLLQWIKSNNAPNLLIVTDVDEVSHDLRLFLESEGAKIQGDGVKPFTSEDLIDYARELSKMCS